MLRSNRAALAAVSTIFLLACGGAEPSGTDTNGGGNTPGKGNGNGGPLQPPERQTRDICIEVCDKATAAQCNDNPTCKGDCISTIEQFPAECRAEIKGLFDCWSKHPFVCDEENTPAVQDCVDEAVALNQCVAELENGEPDPTYGGRCLPGSSTPENSTAHCGELRATPKLYECSGGPPKAGCVDDPYGGHHLYCCPA